MIRFYFHPTPNPAKVALFLEEAGLPYETVPVDTSKGEQHLPAFRAINPNGKVPAIVDTDGPGGTEARAFDSTAILLYLAEKTGKFGGKDLRARTETNQWLFWQMGGLGPMAGQYNHFGNYAPEKLPYAIDRYRNEVNRLYGVMNKRLADRDYLAGEYSIADMASYPWVVPWERQGQNINDFPHLKRWLDAIAGRDAVKRAYAKATEVNPNPGGIRTAEERAILFGQTAQSVDRMAAR